MPYVCAPLETRLLRYRRVTQQDCWVWTGSRGRGNYGLITVKCDGRWKKVLVHRLAAEIWLGFDRSDRHQINHRCDNPPCFNPSHLVRGTQKENVLDAMRKLRHVTSWARGEDAPRAKFTWNEIRKIRSLAKRKVPQRTIGRLFGISQGHVSNIVTKRIW